MLGCSQSAVSQSIKQIETRLGFQLFQRSGKGVLLTSSGDRFLKTLESSWTSIEKSARLERRSTNFRSVRLCAAPSFALNWLLPRMPNFYAANEMIQIELEIKENIFHMNESDADVVISYWNYARYPFLEDRIFPVCSPAFAKAHDLNPKMDRKSLIARLMDLPLIGEHILPFETRTDAWTYWCHRSNMDLLNVTIRRHALSHISLIEAELGLGVAMARSSLAEEALAQDRLLCLSDTQMSGPYKYFLELRVSTPEAEAVGNWLTGEARNSKSATSVESKLI